jgi:hypothetical protein
MDKTMKKAIALGMIGGFVATIGMDIVMFIQSYLMNQPLTTNWAVIGDAVGKGFLSGLIIHYIIGPCLGLIFGIITARFDPLRIDSIRKGIWLGLWAGIITIPLGCVPTAILAGVPVLNLVIFSLLPHIVWGFILGIIVGCGLTPPQT